MCYLLDANVLIDANRKYYPLERVPEFWDWLGYQGSQGSVAVPLEIYEEIEAKNDDLTRWARSTEIRAALLLAEEVTPELVSQVVSEGYAPDLTDDEIEQLGRDPFLIADALAERESQCVVTTEVSKPGRQRADRHIPDVCRDLGVQCCDTFRLLRDLDFRTGWRGRL